MLDDCNVSFPSNSKPITALPAGNNFEDSIEFLLEKLLETRELKIREIAIKNYCHYLSFSIRTNCDVASSE